MPDNQIRQILTCLNSDSAKAGFSYEAAVAPSNAQLDEPTFLVPGVDCGGARHAATLRTAYRHNDLRERVLLVARSAYDAVVGHTLLVGVEKRRLCAGVSVDRGFAEIAVPFFFPYPPRKARLLIFIRVKPLISRMKPKAKRLYLRFY